MFVDMKISAHWLIQIQALYHFFLSRHISHKSRLNDVNSTSFDSKRSDCFQRYGVHQKYTTFVLALRMDVNQSNYSTEIKTRTKLTLHR